MRRLAPMLIAVALLVSGCSLLESESAPGTAEVTPSEEPPVGGLPTQAELDEAREIADGLTPYKLAGQLIVARHKNEENSLKQVEDRHFAGVMVTSPQILDVATSDPLSEVKDFNRRLHDAGEKRGIPVMAPIDQEGGIVARLGEPLTSFPTALSFGAAVGGRAETGEQSVTAAMRGSAAELRAAGYNTVFAPIADMTIGAADPIIGSRSPGDRPDVVSRAVLAAVDGYTAGGVISSVKHFPGHNVADDSHEDMPVLDSSLKDLRSHDMAPFEAAVEAGAPAIMTGHIEVPAIEKGVPASMSRKVVTGELRERLGYTGLIVSDSLGMGAVMKRYQGGQVTVQAIKAGNDIALMPANNAAAHKALREAIESGDIPIEQARDSATRVIAALLHAQTAEEREGDPGSHAEEAAQLSRDAITLVKGPCEPLDYSSVSVSGDAAVVSMFREEAAEVGLEVGSGPRVVLTSHSGASGDVVVALDTPFPLARSSAEVLIGLYGANRGAMRALAEALAGDFEAPGRLPVNVPGLDAVDCD